MGAGLAATTLMGWLMGLEPMTTGTTIHEVTGFKPICNRVLEYFPHLTDAAARLPRSRSKVSGGDHIMGVKLRWVVRNGEKVLRYRAAGADYTGQGWHDIPVVLEESKD